MPRVHGIGTPHLPGTLGYTVGTGERDRTSDGRFVGPMPFHLATPANIHSHMSSSISIRPAVLSPKTMGGRFPRETSKQLQHNPIWSGTASSSQHDLTVTSETSISHLSHLIVFPTGIDPMSCGYRPQALPLS